MALNLLRFGHDELDRLSVKLSNMGGLVEHQLNDALVAFEKRDLPLAHSAIKQDDAIDRAEDEIEATVLQLLETKRLTGDDLRSAISTMKVANELERIGDLARNVATRSLIISEEDTSAVVTSVARMGQIAIRQLSDVLNALGTKNTEAAMAVWEGDQTIDELYNSIFREILMVMMKDASHATACTHLMFVAKNIERAGDHMTNVAEYVYYRFEGERIEQARPKRDITSKTSIMLGDMEM